MITLIFCLTARLKRTIAKEVIAKMSEELDRIEALDKEMLVPTDVAKYLGCCPYSINVATRDGKNPFPFPVIRMGSRVRIPKIPFVKAMRGETE
jgi:hypothetical protein